MVMHHTNKEEAAFLFVSIRAFVVLFAHATAVGARSIFASIPPHSQPYPILDIVCNPFSECRMTMRSSIDA